MIRVLKPALVAMAFTLAACGSPETETPKQSTDPELQTTETTTDTTDTRLEWINLENGLRFADIVVGEGEEVQNGQVADMHYTGWLYDETQPEGKGEQFDSSRDQNVTLQFVLGGPNIIEGWNVGIAGMKVGGRRMLIIPPELGYGDEGRDPIPGGATMLFDVELVAIL